MKATLIENTPDIQITLSVTEAKALYWGVNPLGVYTFGLSDETADNYFDLALDLEATVAEALEDAGVTIDDDVEGPDDEPEQGQVIAVDFPEFYDPDEVARIMRDSLNRAFNTPIAWARFDGIGA